MKTYKFIDRFNTIYTIKLNIYKYGFNGPLALTMDYWDNEFKCWMPYGRITVNSTNSSLKQNEGYVDINNLGPEILDFIEQNKLGVRMSGTMYTRFANYPIYKFNLDKFQKEGEDYDKEQENQNSLYNDLLMEQKEQM